MIVLVCRSGTELQWKKGVFPLWIDRVFWANSLSDPAKSKSGLMCLGFLSCSCQKIEKFFQTSKSDSKPNHVICKILVSRLWARIFNPWCEVRGKEAIPGYNPKTNLTSITDHNKLMFWLSAFSNSGFIFDSRKEGDKTLMVLNFFFAYHANRYNWKIYGAINSAVGYHLESSLPMK